MPIQLAQCWLAGLAISNAKIYPHERRHSRGKLSQELKGKYATFFAKYTCVEMASRKRQTYQNEAKNLCTIFLCLTWTLSANSLKQNIIVTKQICSWLRPCLGE